MSKRARVTAAFAAAIALAVLALEVEGAAFWIGIGSIGMAVVGLGWVAVRHVRGDWSRSLAITNALWSVTGLSAGLFLVFKVNGFILGFAVFAVVATVYQARHERSG
jgi:hypothetical protein